MEKLTVQEKIRMTGDYVDVVGTVSEDTLTRLTAEVLRDFLYSRVPEKWSLEIALQTPGGKYKINTWPDFGSSHIYADLHTPEKMIGQITARFDDSRFGIDVNTVQFNDRPTANHREASNTSSRDKQKEIVGFLKMIGDSIQ